MNRKQRYAALLTDPRWQKVRLKVMERDGWACVLCGDATSTLTVHHSVYRGNPWDAPTEYLHTLCVECHSIVQEIWTMARAARPETIFDPFQIRRMALAALAKTEGNTAPEPWMKSLTLWAEICRAADEGHNMEQPDASTIS